MIEALPSENLIRLLYAPVFGTELPREEVYRAACAGAVLMLSEQGQEEALGEVALRAPAEETRLRALRTLVQDALEGKGAASRVLLTLGLRDAHPAIPELLKRFALTDDAPEWECGKWLLLGDISRLKQRDPALFDLTKLFLSGDEVLRRRMLSLSAEKLPHWMMLCSFFHGGDSEIQREKLISAYGKFSSDEKQLFSYLTKQMSAERADIAADLFLKYEDSELKDLCINLKLFPKDPQVHGLFAFLSEQWGIYSEKDSAYRAVRSAFENGSSELKRRLIEIARKSGHTSWLSESDSGVFGERRGGNTLSEWQLLIQTLRSSAEWEKLRALLPTVPLLCLADVLDALPAEQKCSADEAEWIEQMRTLVKRLPNEVPLPLVVCLNEAGTVVCGMGCGGGKIALSFVDREIRVWNGLEPKPETIITSGRMNFRRLCISSNGRYLCADCGDGTAAVFSLQKGQLLKSFSVGKQSLCGMTLTKDGKYLICADTVGTVRSYSFPDGTLLSTFESGLSRAERCSFEDAESCLILSDASGEIIAVDPMRGETLLRLRAENGITSVAECVKEHCVTAADRENRLFSRSLFSGMDRYCEIDCGVSARILRIAEIQSGELCALSAGDGSGILVQPSTGKKLASFSKAGERPVTGLCAVSERLVAAHSDGCLKIFDLRLLNWVRNSFDLLNLPDLNEIDAFCHEYASPEVITWAELLRSVILRRRRFDIEVDFDFEG